MTPCNHCVRLENWLQAASDQYVSLVTQHNKMIQESIEARTVENATRKAQRRRNAAARLFLAHKRTHEDFARPKVSAAM